jgi:hypothetical protein
MKRALVLVTAIVLLTASSAAAQVARVFLAGSGDDLNDCSQIGTPCRSLQGAVNQCPAKGEVIIITSGGFGSASINKSLTIDTAPGVIAFNARSIHVTIGAADTVTLRHLVLNGAIFGDLTGIVLAAGGTLNLENCDIGGFPNYGIFDEAGAGSTLRLSECNIHDSSIGLYVLPPAGAATRLTLSHCQFHDVSNVAVWAYDSTVATINDSRFSHAHVAVAAYSVTAAMTTSVSISRSMISNCDQGLNATATNSGTALIFLSSSSMNGNGVTYLSTGTGATSRVVSFGNNVIANNTSTPAFAITLPLR